MTIIYIYIDIHVRDWSNALNGSELRININPSPFSGEILKNYMLNRVTPHLPSGNLLHSYWKWPFIKWIFPLNMVDLSS